MNPFTRQRLRNRQRAQFMNTKKQAQQKDQRNEPKEKDNIKLLVFAIYFLSTALFSGAIIMTLAVIFTPFGCEK